MKGFSDFLDKETCKDRDYEVSSWKYLTIWRPVRQALWSTKCLALRPDSSQVGLKVSRCNSTGLQTEQGSVSTEEDGKRPCFSVTGNCSGQVPVCSWHMCLLRCHLPTPAYFFHLCVTGSELPWFLVLASPDRKRLTKVIQRQFENCW